ncbi:hypothetical protein O181_068341 [Austropuccinia psidii MF-1]|uniref:Uncharacterized protein n=1 Tax=Austropuccinia psidii MF-1 TaxID=1389203 RepID=A0A9Q3I3U9_9BASI|nr:hypothetical protein [Austropuccinia psidii MF-1]
MPRHTTFAYDHFMQEPYRAADCFAPLKRNSSNLAEWLACLNWVISVAFNTEIITPSQSTAKAFFVAIRACCSPRKHFEKLRLVRSILTMLIKNGSGTPRPNNVIIFSLHRTFVLLKKLGIKANKLEGLLAQAVCHAPATLDQTAFDQLVTTAILAKGDEKPTSTFVGQIILNASTKTNEDNRQLSPFVYRIADPSATPTYPQRPCSPGPTPQRSGVHLITLSTNLVTPAFTVDGPVIGVPTAQSPRGS